MRARLPISASRFSSAFAPAATPITAIRPPVRERLQVLGQVRRADELEDHVERAVLGEVLGRDHLGAERRDLLAQLPRCAPSRSRARRPRGRAGSPRCRRRRRRRARAGARRGAARACVKIASWAVVKTSGRPPAAGQSSACRDGHQLRSWTDGQLGLRAAADDRHHALADREALGAGSERGHLAGELHAGDVLRRAGRRRVEPAPLHHVRAVQPGRVHPHEHLAGARGRDRGAPRSRSPAREWWRRASAEAYSGPVTRSRAPPKNRRPLLGRSRRTWETLEQRNALDVVRLGEHVHGANLHQLPARLHQLGGVGRERGRVAGDVDDALGRGLDDPAHDFLGEPGARRVDDEHVGAAGALAPARAAPGGCRRRRSGHW